MRGATGLGRTLIRRYLPVNHNPHKHEITSNRIFNFYFNNLLMIRSMEYSLGLGSVSTWKYHPFQSQLLRSRNFHRLTTLIIWLHLDRRTVYYLIGPAHADKFSLIPDHRFTGLVKRGSLTTIAHMPRRVTTFIALSSSASV